MKKMLKGILLLSLILGLAVPVYATEGQNADQQAPEGNGNAEISADVQAVYDAYQQVSAALESKSMDALKDSVAAMEEVTDIFNGMMYPEEGQEAEAEAALEDLAGLMGMSAEDACSAVFSDYVNASVVVNMAGYYDAYISAPGVDTASDWVEQYDYIYNDPDYADETLQTLVTAFIPEGTAAYESAKELLPSANVQAVYDAYQEVVFSLEYYSDPATAIEVFSPVLETLNALNEAEWEEMAALIGAEDGEAAYSKILTDWIDINVVQNMRTYYDNFWNDPNTFTAYEFVTAHNNLAQDSSYAELMVKMNEGFFTDLEDTYQEAAGMMPTEAVMMVYDAVKLITETLESGADIDDTVLQTINRAVEVLNKMGEDDLADLALFVEAADGEDAKAMVNLMSTYANKIAEAGKAYNAFLDNDALSKAEALVKIYEEIFKTEATADEVLRELVLSYYPEIEDAYKDAAKIVAAGEKMVKAGDETNLLLYVGVLAVCAAGAVVVAMRRKRA